MRTKLIVSSLILGISVTAASVANAQSQKATDVVTREQVKKELVQIEAAGFDPHRDSSTYPADLQEAESRAAATSRPASAPASGTRKQ